MTDTSQLSRRGLLSAGGVCALGFGSAAVLTACGSSSDSSTASSATSAASAAGSSAATAASSAASSAAAGGSAIAALADVPVGGTATVDVAGKAVLLSQPTAGQVLGFSAICPHQGSTVKPDGAGFKCPTHGSMFSATGDVTQGPALKGLTAENVTVTGTDITLA